MIDVKETLDIELTNSALCQYFGQFWNRDAPRAELKKSLESEPKIKKKGTF